MMEGWIKLYRQLLTNGWFQNHNLLIVWIYCLLKASHKAMTATIGYQRIPLEPGQFIFGRRKAAEETGLSEKKIRTCMNILKTCSNLAIKRANKFSIVSIINWEAYQAADIAEGPANGQSKGPTKGQQRATYKNDKNEKNKRLFVQGSIELELASFLLEKIRKNKPDFKEPDLQAWARAFDLMIRRDERAPGRIREVIFWAQGDSFWSPNILSAGKLREKFDHLEMKMGKSFPPKNLPPGNGTGRKENPSEAKRREMEAAEAVPCPPDLRPDFLKESGS